jgi:hypothetical protein
MNAIEFKNSLTVSKFKKVKGSFNVGEYIVTINDKDYIIDQPKKGKWACYDEVEREYYAINNTRKDVLKDIISGLYYQYKYGL